MPGGRANIGMFYLGQSVEAPKWPNCKAAVRHATFHNLRESSSKRLAGGSSDHLIAA